MEGGKDKHRYPPEHCSPYGIFNSITKCYLCNESDVESFIFNEEGILLNSGEGHNHAAANECAGVPKGEHICDDFLCKGNFEESVNINHADRRSASTLAKRGKGTRKDDTNLLDVKNGISGYAYLGERTSHVLQTNGPFCRNVVYTSKERPTNRTYIPRVNSDEKIKPHDHYVYVEECHLQRETRESITKGEPRSTRSTFNTSLSEDKPFNYPRKKDHLERVDNTSSIYHPDDEHTYVYDNLTAHNGAKDELTLKKIKTTIHLGDKLKDVSKSEYLAKYLGPFPSAEIEEHNAASPSVEDKQLTRHKESNSNNHEMWGTCTDGIATPKGCKEESCSMIHITTEGTNVVPHLVDNFSQTVGKKKKIAKMKRRLKIGLKGRRRKKTKNALLKKKPCNGNKLRVSRTKKMKVTYSRKRIPMGKEKKGYAHRGNNKRNKLSSKNAKECAPCKLPLGKGDKKAPSDMRNGGNEHLAQRIYSKLQGRHPKNKRRESKPLALSQTKVANRKSHTNREKIKKGKEVKRDKKVQEVAKNSIQMDESKNLTIQNRMQRDDVEEASILNGEVNSDEVNIVPGRDSDSFPAPKMATKSVGSGSCHFCLSDDVSNSSYRSLLEDTHSVERLKITECSDRTDGVPRSGETEEEEAAEVTSICGGEYTTADENEERLTFAVLRKVANFLGGGSGDEQSGETVEEATKSFNVDRDGQRVDQLVSNPQIDEPQEGGLFCEMVTSTRGVRGRGVVRSTSDDSFFEKAILNRDAESSILIDTCAYRQSCQTDKNLFLLHSNMLKQRSFFHQHGTLKKEVRYILNCLTFYCNKLKNVLNYAIGRRSPNGGALQAKLFTLCLINLAEKAKGSANPSACLKTVSTLMNELVERVRYGVLSLSKNGEVTKFEQVIMKTYLIELIKMGRLLLTSLGGVKNRSPLPSRGEKSPHKLEASAGGEVPKMSKLKASRGKQLVRNAEDSRVFEPPGNGNGNGNGDGDGDENATDRVKGKGSGVMAVANSIVGDINQMSKLTNEAAASQRDHPSHCDVYKLMKGLKKKLLLLEQNSQSNFCSVRLMLKYLDKLSYVYRVNSALRVDPEGGKSQGGNTANQVANQLDDQISHAVRTMEGKISAWTRGSEVICDIPTLYSIKSVQKKMEKNVFAFFEHLSGKASHGRRPTGVSPRVATQNGSVQLEGGKMAHVEMNGVKNKCHGKQKRGIHNVGEKKTFADNPVRSFHDETEHLERLNECLTEVILIKEELMTNPNGHYAMLKEYKEELSLLNDLRNGENDLVNDFLDHMPSSNFTQMLGAYVRGGNSRGGHSGWGLAPLRATQQVPAFFEERNEKKGSGLPLEENSYVDIPPQLSNEECLDHQNGCSGCPPHDGKMLEDALPLSEPFELHHEGEPSRGNSLQLNFPHGSTNSVKYFKIY
ncbi:unnamed protein product [Plasmodium vivax]|uniref:Uncharacterized protein n=2 Tax=Plasmodium vivax TaxID=5855 RepID=A0A0J9TXI4_PLAVI|nr:hypothetical protein PVNG_01009 [Plasmodium vivax North Korean]CAG9480536.1 unnamed protein product [Plasmodium vivax]